MKISIIQTLSFLVALGFFVTVTQQSHAVENSVPFQVVGFSSTTHAGNEGIKTFTRACQSDYRASRMCSSEEFMHTVNFPALPATTQAWIRPVIQGPANAAFDMSGVQGRPRDLSCLSWSNTSATGLTVSEKGHFVLGFCGQRYPVACCAPRKWKKTKPR